MSELHKFLFDGLPVRGMFVRLTDAWQEILTRRQAAGGYPEPVAHLLGEMTAAAALMQGHIKFNGALILQIFGEGPVKLAVAEVQPDLSLRATATVTGSVKAHSSLSELVNVNNQGRYAITLDPKDKLPRNNWGQIPNLQSAATKLESDPNYFVAPLFGDSHEKIESLSEVLEHYMLQSEQLDTRLILAADGRVAAGLLIQRLPVKGQGNLEGRIDRDAHEDQIGVNEDYRRIAMLAATLKREELLSLDADTILRRLFWQEPLTRFAALTPRFSCSCSYDRVRNMLQGLGATEIDSIIAERGNVAVGCEFCGAQYVFDPVDAAQLFTSQNRQPPPAATVQ